jgi:hypothetical protein
MRGNPFFLSNNVYYIYGSQGDEEVDVIIIQSPVDLATVI